MGIKTHIKEPTKLVLPLIVPTWYKDLSQCKVHTCIIPIQNLGYMHLMGEENHSWTQDENQAGMKALKSTPIGYHKIGMKTSVSRVIPQQYRTCFIPQRSQVQTHSISFVPQCYIWTQMLLSAEETLGVQIFAAFYVTYQPLCGCDDKCLQVGLHIYTNLGLLY